MAKSEKVDSAKELTRLERRHKKLKERVAEYEARVFLNASEQVEVATLKKEKLATKDLIAQLSTS
jgi:hypothetical protein